MASGTRRVRAVVSIENLGPIVVKDAKLAENVKLRARWRSSNDMRRFSRTTTAHTRGFQASLKIYFVETGLYLISAYL